MPDSLKKHMNPERAGSYYKGKTFSFDHWNKFKDHLNEHFNNEMHAVAILLRDELGTNIFKVGNSGLYAYVTLTTGNDFNIELLASRNDIFDKEEVQQHSFRNERIGGTEFEDVVKLINSSFEVSIYGQRIPLKTRPKTSTEIIDIGFKITPITDPKQTTASV